MSFDSSDRISNCVARISDLRARGDAEHDPLLKAEFRLREAQWFEILESYQLIDAAGSYLRDVRARRSRALQTLPSLARNGASLSDVLGVLVGVAVEHAEGKARAAFYLADAAEKELHHITGMTDAYAKCVDGFAIGKHSLACGLAVARREPVITPDVSEEPRWKEWLWLAEEFCYRACWSFPIEASSGRVLGCFAIYYPERRETTPRDLDMASVLTRTAARIIASC
jgi:GAF domain-containing protein